MAQWYSRLPRPSPSDRTGLNPRRIFDLERKPHILQLIETGEPGGAERVLINLAQGLNESGEARASAGLIQDGWLRRRLMESKVPVHLLTSRYSLDFPFLFSLVRLIRSHRVKLLHAHEFNMNLYASLAGSLLRIPVVATVHGKNYYP